jgi:1-acyl-sn-glycerol-3-phosphate acyltransferase
MSLAASDPRSLPTRMVQGFLLWLFRRKGWKIIGAAPDLPKYVITGAPHTSNWDFVVFIGVTHYLGIRPRFMGKDSLFRWPMRRFMLEMGGVPVRRSASHNYVDAMVEAFAAHDDFKLVVAPEGTRGSAGKWRSGFYHIALGAGVPVVPAWVDNAAMRGGLGPAIHLTGDYAGDMARIAAYYETVMPGHPKLAGMMGRETRSDE